MLRAQIFSFCQPSIVISKSCHVTFIPLRFTWLGNKRSLQALHNGCAHSQKFLTRHACPDMLQQRVANLFMGRTGGSNNHTPAMILCAPTANIRFRRIIFNSAGPVAFRLKGLVVILNFLLAALAARIHCDTSLLPAAGRFKAPAFFVAFLAALAALADAGRFPQIHSPMGTQNSLHPGLAGSPRRHQDSRIS